MAHDNGEGGNVEKEGKGLGFTENMARTITAFQAAQSSLKPS